MSWVRVFQRRVNWGLTAPVRLVIVLSIDTLVGLCLWQGLSVKMLCSWLSCSHGPFTFRRPESDGGLGSKTAVDFTKHSNVQRMHEVINTAASNWQGGLPFFVHSRALLFCACLAFSSFLIRLRSETWGLGRQWTTSFPGSFLFREKDPGWIWSRATHILGAINKINV